MFDNVYLSYLAGFFDGEGTISIRPKIKQCPFVLFVSITNTRRDVLDIIKNEYGGCITTRKRPGNNKPAFTWKTFAKKAILFLNDIGPYLILKKEHYNLAVELRSGKVLSRGKDRNPDKDIPEILRRSIIHNRIKDLNHRGLPCLTN